MKFRFRPHLLQDAQVALVHSQHQIHSFEICCLKLACPAIEVNAVLACGLLHSRVRGPSHMPVASPGGAYNNTILQPFLFDQGLKNTLGKWGTANISKTYKTDFNG
jgi:hypothetical protein